MCQCHELKDSISEKTGSHADQEKCINVVIGSTPFDICNTVLNVNDIFNVKIKFLRKFLSIFHVVTTAKRHMRRRRNECCHLQERIIGTRQGFFVFWL